MTVDETAAVINSMTAEQLRRALTLVSGHAPDTFAVIAADADTATDIKSRPYWLKGHCPSWCRAEHENSDRPDERTHWSITGDVELTQMPPVHMGGNPAHDDTWSCPTLIASLRQGVRESEPQVIVSDAADIPLTLDEAEQLSEILADLVKLARTGAVE